MSGGYRVDVGRLGSLNTTLEQAGERLSGANAKLRDLTSEDLGSRDVDVAGGEFRDRWGYGIGKIGELSGVVAEGLSKAKQVYAEMEEKVAGAFGKGGGGQPAPPVVAAAGGSGIAARLEGRLS